MVCKLMPFTLTLKVAFDSVSRSIFPAKLDRLGLPPPMVKYNLGPLLFVLYINDLCTLLPNNSCLLYRRWCSNIHRQIREPEDHLRLQANFVPEFVSWCKRNAQSVCIDKCANLISFSRSRAPALFNYGLDGQNLERVYCVKDLEVHLGAKLSFEEQIYQVVASCNWLHGLVIKMARERRVSRHCTGPSSESCWNTLALFRGPHPLGHLRGDSSHPTEDNALRPPWLAASSRLQD